MRFTKANNLTRLPHETVIWNSSTKTAEIWVQVDSVFANNSTQTIRMHWGKVGAADSSSSGQVFNSGNGFVSVWHMGNAADSSARPNAVTGAPPATPVFFGGNPTYTAPAGIIGMADTLRGSAAAAAGNTNHDYISVLNGVAHPGFTGYNSFPNGYTLTAWIRPADVRSFTHFVDMNSDNTTNGYNTIYLGRNGVTSQLASRNRTGTTSNGANANANAATDIVSDNATWQYFTASKPNAATAVTLYKGRTAATTTAVGSNVVIPSDSARKWVYMGKSFDATNVGYAGGLDEIRIANTTRNADWVALDFETQKAAQLVTDIGLAAPTLAYTPDSATYVQGNAISSVTPVVSGVSVTYTGSLPAGLALDASTGVISGTPTTPSAFTKYTITATNLGGSVTDSIFIRVNPAAPTGMAYVSNNLTLMVGTAMTADSVAITNLVDSFTVVPALPAGLSLNATNGAITGTPSAVTASADYIITATNVTGIAKDTVTILVNPAIPIISYATPKVYTLGVLIDTLAPVSTGGPAASYAITPNLNTATGLTFNTSTGTVTGTATTLAPAADYTIIATNVSGTDTAVVNITVNAAVPVIAYASPKVYQVGVVADTLSPASTGGIVVSYSITPNLNTATGLDFNTTTGKVTGTPTIATAAADYTIIATNTGGLDTAVVNIRTLLATPIIAYATPKVYQVGIGIDTLSPVSTGGLVASYSVSPNLATATGLAFNTTTGKITGTPTTETAAADYTIIATNEGGADTAVVNITVIAAFPNISYTTPKVYQVGVVIDTLSPISVGGPVTGYTINPNLNTATGLAFNATTGKITGTPSLVTPATDYTVIATGPGGADTAIVSIRTLPATPIIAYATPKVYVVGTSIDTLNPVSTGGSIASFAITPNLNTATGLTFNTTTGTITGTPTTAVAAADYTVIATNAGGADTAVVNITINAAVPVISYATPKVYTVGLPIAALNVSSTGGPVTGYTISPNVTTLTGLAFNTSTGSITGTPTLVTLSTNYSVIATGPGGLDTAVVNITTTNEIPPSIVYADTVVYTKGVSVVLLAPDTTGSGPIDSIKVSPALPAGLTLNASTGVISGTPSALAVSDNYTVTAHGLGGIDQEIINLKVVDVIPSGFAYSTPPVSPYIVGTPITTQFPNNGGGVIVSYSISPDLNAHTGLTFNTTNGQISGTPTSAHAATTYSVIGTNTGGSDTATIDITVLIAPPTLSYSPLSVVDTVGVAVTHTPTATGVASCAVTPTLPAGLSINSSCVISGTPSAAIGNNVYVVTAKNSTDSVVANIEITVLIAKPTIAYTPSTVVDTVDVAASHAATTSGTITSCSIAPAIPGLSVNATTCAITGTPTTASAAANYTITASNSTGSATATLNLAVLIAKPTIAYTPSTVVDTVGVAASHAATTSGTITSCSISPTIAGLSVNATTCAITGTPTTASAAANYTITASNSTGSATATLNLAVLIAKPTIAYTPSTVVDTVGVAASHAATTSGTITSCSIAPAIPGLSVNATTCAITGTPTTASAAANYTITASNSTGSATATLNLAVLIAKPTIAYTPSTVVDTVGVAASHAATTSGTITSCSIAPAIAGLSVNATTCAITGTPTTASAASNYTVTATNSTGSATATLNVAVLIAKPTIAYTPSTVSDTVGTAASHVATTTGTITSCSIAPAIAGFSVNATTCAITGTPTTASAASNYTVTATNSTGSATATINIAVLIAKPTIAYTPSTVVDTVGIAASHSATTSGTITSCSIAPAIAGLSVNATTCAITGTPTTASASAAYTVTATNGTGSATATINIAVLIPKPTIAFTPSTVVDTIGKAASHTATTTGTITSCSIAPAIPGLSVNATTCAITGTPTTASAATNYTVTATNSTGSATATLNLAVLIAKPTIAFTPSTVSDTVGTAASHTATTTGTITACSIAPAIPGLTVNATTCAITGTPTTASASAAYTVTATNSTGSATATLNVAVLIAKPTIAYTPSTVVDTVGTAASHVATTTGTITSCSIAPAIAGLTVNATTCAITGTPTTASASAAYTVTATNSTGAATATINIAVLIAKPTIAYTPATVVDTVGKAASHAATTTGTITSCSIAPAIAGLTVNATTCAITGTPTTAAAAANYTVTATNSTGSATATLNVTILIPAPTNLAYAPDSLVFKKDTTIAAWTPTVTGTVTTYSVTPTLPAGLSLNTTTGVITGTPTAVAALASYTVTAANGTGSTTKVIKITVIQVVAILPDAFVIRVNGQEKPYAFQLPAGTTTEKLTLSIIDAWGRTIWVKSVNPAKDKMTEVSWNGKSANGRQASAGMYIVRISVLNAGTTTNYVRRAVTLKPR